MKIKKIQKIIIVKKRREMILPKKLNSTKDNSICFWVSASQSIKFNI
jgi:hypothetical protein